MLGAVLFFPAALAGLSFAYVGICIAALLRFRARIRNMNESKFRPPITILWPICGMETDLEANLCSFCRQDYEDFRIVFGVHDNQDAAIPGPIRSRGFASCRVYTHWSLRIT